MSGTPELDPRTALGEKLATQAETGFGRSMARPAGALAGTSLPIGDGIGSVGLAGGGVSDAVPGLSGMSGAETNDTMPGGAAIGDQAQPDSVNPGIPTPPEQR